MDGLVCTSYWTGGSPTPALWGAAGTALVVPMAHLNCAVTT